LTLAAAAANCHDLLGKRKVDPLDADCHTQNLRFERKRKVLLDHSEQSGALLRVVVGVYGRILNEFPQPALAGRPRGASRFGGWGLPLALSPHAKVVLPTKSGARKGFDNIRGHEIVGPILEHLYATPTVELVF